MRRQQQTTTRNLLFSHRFVTATRIGTIAKTIMYMVHQSSPALQDHLVTAGWKMALVVNDCQCTLAASEMQTMEFILGISSDRHTRWRRQSEWINHETSDSKSYLQSMPQIPKRTIRTPNLDSTDATMSQHRHRIYTEYKHNFNTTLSLHHPNLTLLLECKVPILNLG